MVFGNSFRRIVRAVAGIAVCSLLITGGGYVLSRIPDGAVAAALPLCDDTTVILDAGHGGEDSGTIGVNGVYEKDLNLAISGYVAAYLRSAGVTVIETRTEDILLYREEENVKGYRKMYDLKNRLAVANANPDAIFVSIHMNSFTVPKYRGLQVYYSANTPESRVLAETIQTTVRTNLQPDNTRMVKPADAGIFLLDRAESTAVLVECGFLSNPEECSDLSRKDYQKQLSFLLFCGIMLYISNSEP